MIDRTNRLIGELDKKPVDVEKTLAQTLILAKDLSLAITCFKYNKMWEIITQ